MKIAIVYDAIYPYVKGGGEKRIYEISKVLSKKHEIHIFGMKYWKGNKVIIKDNIYLHGVCNSISIYNKKGKRSLIEPFYFSFFLFKELIKYDFDLVDCQNFPYLSCFACKLYSKLKKKSLMITWLETIDTGFIGLLEKSTLRLTENNIALRDNVTRLKNQEVIPAGIDLKRIKKVKSSAEKFDVIFVGRLIKDKNVSLLLNSAKDLNLKLCIIGDGPEKSNLISLSHHLKLNASFKGFLDGDEEVYAYMKSSKILVLPSIREGFGIVVLEALACGCKVITTNHKNNNARFLVDENFTCEANAESLKNKIEFALDNSYHNKIKLEEYDINVIANNIEKYYLRCVNEI